MKKTLKLILLAVLLFAVMLVFTACGNLEEETSSGDAENSSSSAVSENEENEGNAEEATDEEESSNTSSSGNRAYDQADEARDETTIASVTESVNMVLHSIVSDYLENSVIYGTSGELDEYIEENLENELNEIENAYTVDFTGSITTDSTENCEIEHEGETYLFSITLSENGNDAEVEYVE